jgi:hypothetical protein
VCPACTNPYCSSKLCRFPRRASRLYSSRSKRRLVKAGWASKLCQCKSSDDNERGRREEGKKEKRSSLLLKTTACGFHVQTQYSLCNPRGEKTPKLFLQVVCFLCLDSSSRCLPLDISTEMPLYLYRLETTQEKRHRGTPEFGTADTVIVFPFRSSCQVKNH